MSESWGTKQSLPDCRQFAKWPFREKKLFYKFLYDFRLSLPEMWHKTVNCCEYTCYKGADNN